MAEFDPAVNIVLSHEGSEYVDHPIDSGGPTKYGITIQTLVSVKGLGVTKDDVKQLSLDEAKDIYKRRYWLPTQMGSIAVQTTADVIFDMVVLLGPQSAAKRAQIALKRLNKQLNVTGKFDPQTINQINSTDPVYFGVEFVIECQSFLAQLVADRPAQVVFIKGWLNRTNALLRHSIQLT